MREGKPLAPIIEPRLRKGEFSARSSLSNVTVSLNEAWLIFSCNVWPLLSRSRNINFLDTVRTPMIRPATEKFSLGSEPYSGRYEKRVFRSGKEMSTL